MMYHHQLPYGNQPVPQAPMIYPPQVSPTRHIVERKTIVHIIPHFHPVPYHPIRRRRPF